MTMKAMTVSVSIDRDWNTVYETIWRPETFPTWASGLAESTLVDHGHHWSANGPAGMVTIRFTPHNAFGVMDHTVRLESGVEIDVPLRVFKNGDGAEVALTLFRQPSMSAEQFESDLTWVRRDLTTLARQFAV